MKLNGLIVLFGLMFGLALGLQLGATGRFSPEIFSKSPQFVESIVIPLSALYVGLLFLSQVIELVDRSFDDNVIEGNQFFPRQPKSGELAILLMRDGEIVNFIESYDQLPQRRKLKLRDLFKLALGRNLNQPAQLDDGDKDSHQQTHEAEPHPG